METISYLIFFFFFHSDDDKYLRDKGRYSVKITIAIALFIRSTLPSQKCKIVHFFIFFLFLQRIGVFAKMGASIRRIKN